MCAPSAIQILSLEQLQGDPKAQAMEILVQVADPMRVLAKDWSQGGM